LHRVNFELPDRAYYVLRHRERYQTRAAEALMTLIHETQKRSAQTRGAASRTTPARRRKR
jgi:hypothetical protein